MGAKPGVQLTQEEFVKAVARFDANQDESRTCLMEATDTVFYALDNNRDRSISLEEYYYKALAKLQCDGP